MSRMSRVRWLVIPAAGATAALLAIPSAEYWAAHPENDRKVAVSGVYAPNTETTMLNALHAAAALPHATTKAWKNVGPFGGVKSIPSVGSGAEQLGPIEGIGTAIAVDPADATGNTVFLATHGGLYK